MAFQPIYGYSGDHPVLNYYSNLPVCMEPYPYTSGSPINGWVYDDEILTLSQNTVRVTSSSIGNFYGSADIPYLYTGAASKTATLTYSLGGGKCEVVVDLYVGGVAGGDYIYWDSYDDASGSYDSLTVPYYRYKISIFILGRAGGAGAWAQVTIS